MPIRIQNDLPAKEILEKEKPIIKNWLQKEISWIE